MRSRMRALTLAVLVAQIAAVFAFPAAALCACPSRPAATSDCCAQPAFEADASCCAPSAARSAKTVDATAAPSLDGIVIEALEAAPVRSADILTSPPARASMPLAPQAPPLVLRI